MIKWILSYFSPSKRDYWNKLGPILALLYWLGFMGVIGVWVAYHPTASSVTTYYHDSSIHWLARADLYSGGHMTMNYLPQFAIVFSPFHLLPVPAGDVLWRLCAIVLLATGILRFAKQIFGDQAPRLFLGATILSLALSAPAACNGQSNMLLGALMLHAAASLSARQWWLAAGLIVSAIVAKPVAIVLALLAPMVYRPLRLPMAVCVVALAAFPFFFAKPDYVMSQYSAFLVNLRSCAAVTEYDYADITGILWPLHVRMSVAVSQIVRVSAGLLTLLVWWWGARRLRESLRAFWLFTLAAGYLMLFNPMTESNSYVVLVPALAIWAVYFLYTGHAGAVWILSIMAFSMGLLPNIVRPWFGNKFALCYHPVMTILFLGMLIAWVWRGETAEETHPSAGSKAPVVS